MVEGTGLENRRTGNGTVSSNLTLSVRGPRGQSAAALGTLCNTRRRTTRDEDRWPSGLRRTPGKRVGGQPSRGFESLPVRRGDMDGGACRRAPPLYSRAMQSQHTLLDARAFDRTLTRMANEILELNAGTDALVLVGIQRRGVQLADRLARTIHAAEGVEVARGALDITLYRDDLQTVGPRPVVGPTSLPTSIDGARVVIVDDVLYTGRTVRAALDELADFGRPSRIALAVLVDRGGRELPIHADVVGRRVDVAVGGRVDVLVAELDGRDAVLLQAPPARAPAA